VLLLLLLATTKFSGPHPHCTKPHRPGSTSFMSHMRHETGRSENDPGRGFFPVSRLLKPVEGEACVSRLGLSQLTTASDAFCAAAVRSAIAHGSIRKS